MSAHRVRSKVRLRDSDSPRSGIVITRNYPSARYLPPENRSRRLPPLPRQQGDLAPERDALRRVVTMLEGIPVTTSARPASFLRAFDGAGRLAGDTTKE